MFSYYVGLGFRSLSHQKLLTAWMILLISLGVAGTVTTFSLLRAVSSNPFTAKAHRLYTPQIDNRGPEYIKTATDMDPVITMRDARALLVHDEARLSTAIYPVDFTLVPSDTAIDPLRAQGYAVAADFFRMLDVPFRFGAPWSKASDHAGGNDIVIGSELNRRLFRGENSVGREISMDGHLYRIVGVLAPWNPLPRFYAAVDVQSFDHSAPQVFLSFQRALDLKIPTSGGSYGEAVSGWDELISSENSFISYWVELPDLAAAAQYRSFLQAYAEEQRVNGRFHWPAHVALRDQEQWLSYLHVVPPETRISFVVALGLLAVCAVNTIGLLLARFMRRASDIGVRRALGGSRASILAQYLTEAGVIGLAGGLLGVLLTACFTRGLGLVFPPQIASLSHTTAGTLVLAPLLAIAIVLLAAIYPVLRASRVEPGWQLKSS